MRPGGECRCGLAKPYRDTGHERDERLEVLNWRPKILERRLRKLLLRKGGGSAVGCAMNFAFMYYTILVQISRVGD